MNCYFMHSHHNQNSYSIFIYDDRGEILEVKYDIRTLSMFEDIALSLKQEYEKKGIVKFESGMIPKCFA